MLKRVLIIVFSLFLLLGLTCCSSPCDKSPDLEYKNKVNFVSHEDGTHHIEYENDIFFPFSESIIFVEQSDKDVFLGWNGSWWGYHNHYYSSVKENPVFIYETRLDSLYLRKDYDYATDTFVIENTSEEILWKDILYSKHASFGFFNPLNVVIYSKQCPRIKAELEMTCVGNQWYVSLHGSETVWIPSDKFVNILFENGII